MSSPIIPLVPSDTVWLAHDPFLAHISRKAQYDAAFSALGYKVRALQEASDPALRAQHFYHNIKTLIRKGGNVHPLWTRANNLSRGIRDHTVVVGLARIEIPQVLLVRPDHGKGLKGRQLGLSSAAGEIDVWRAMALRAYDAALVAEGLTFDDVSRVDVQAPPVQWQDQNHGAASQETLTALLEGEVDVIYARGAKAIALQQTHGLDILLDINALGDPASRLNNDTLRMVTVHRHFLDDHPELVRAYLQVSGDVSVDATLQAELQGQADFLFDQGLVPARVEVADWIDAGPLAVANTEPAELALQGAA